MTPEEQATAVVEALAPPCPKSLAGAFGWFEEDDFSDTKWRRGQHIYISAEASDGPWHCLFCGIEKCQSNQ